MSSWKPKICRSLSNPVKKKTAAYPPTLDAANQAYMHIKIILKKNENFEQ